MFYEDPRYRRLVQPNLPTLPSTPRRQEQPQMQPQIAQSNTPQGGMSPLDILGGYNQLDKLGLFGTDAGLQESALADTMLGPAGAVENFGAAMGAGATPVGLAPGMAGVAMPGMAAGLAPWAAAEAGATGVAPMLGEAALADTMLGGGAAVTGAGTAMGAGAGLGAGSGAGLLGAMGPVGWGLLGVGALGSLLDWW